MRTGKVNAFSCSHEVTGTLWLLCHVTI